MHPDLEKLLDLQSKDLTLLEADTAIAELLALEAALDERLARADREAQAAARSLAETVTRREEVQKRLETFRAQQQKRQGRLDVVRNQREATAVMAEIDLGKQVLQREEAEYARLGDEVARLEARCAETERALAEGRAAQEEEREAIAARHREAAVVRNAALEAREQSAAQLERALRTRYDRLRSARNRTAVAPLTGFACSLCYTAVPVSRRAHIKGGLLIDGCEVCGVILYQPDASA